MSFGYAERPGRDSVLSRIMPASRVEDPRMLMERRLARLVRGASRDTQTATFKAHIDGDMDSGTSLSWSTVRDAATASSVATDPATTDIRASQDSGNNFNIIRGVFVFDTTPLPADATVVAARLKLFVSGDNDPTGSATLEIFRIELASDAALAVGDYDGTVESVQYGDRAISLLADSEYNTIDLQAGAVLSADKTRLVAKISLDTDNVEPGVNTDHYVQVNGNGAASSKPLLEVDYYG